MLSPELCAEYRWSSARVHIENIDDMLATVFPFPDLIPQLGGLFAIVL